MPESAARNFKGYIELSVFFLLFAFLISDSIRTNLIIFRTCYVTLGYSKEECALLGSQNPDNKTANLEKIVEPYAAVVTMTNTLTESCSTAIMCLFAGPWSDRFGRKPILVASLMGYMVFYVLSTIFAMLENLSPWYSLVCLVPVYLSGGFPSYFAVVLCYITDTTSDANRGLRMGFLEGAFFLGVFLGTVSSSYLFAATNYLTVFLLSTLCCVINLFFVASYLIPESLINPQTGDRFKGLFQLTSISDMVKIMFKERLHYARYTILCCVLMQTCCVIVMNGNDSVIFLFLREKFHWTLQKYTLFSATNSVTLVLGTVIGVYFLHKILKIPETVLILVALISSVNGALVIGLAQNERLIYAFPLVRLLGGVFGPMIRSLISKIVPNEEVGKIFALVTASQFFFGMAGSPLYTVIYNRTITTNPEIFSFLSAAIYIFVVIIAIGVITVRTVFNRHLVYNHLLNENSEERQFIVENVST